MKDSVIGICCCVVALAVSIQGYGNNEDSTRTPRWYLPHYVPLQFAGNIGFLSTGLGFSSNKGNYHLDVLYGYVPKSVAGSYIHSVSVKNYLPFGRYPIKRAQALIPYAGLGISIEVSGNAFFTLPSHFPESYYDFPKNLHLLVYGGIRFQHLFFDEVKWLRGVEFYGEAGTIDIYLWYKTMTRNIRISNVFSVALGVNVMLAR